MANFKQIPPKTDTKKGKGRKQGSAVVLPGGAVDFFEPRCKVCNSPHRRDIDLALSTGWSQIKVLRFFNQLIPEGELKFNKTNISNHANKHMSIRNSAVRNIMEQRARQLGMDVEAAEDYIVTRTAVLDTIIHSGLLSLHEGTTVAEPDTILKAIAELEKMEADFKDNALDEVMRDFRIFMEAVKEVVGEEQYGEIYDTFERMLDGQQRTTFQPALQEASEHKLKEAKEVLGIAEEVEEAQFEEVDE